MTMVTYGTPRVYLRVVGQYHEPLVRKCDSIDEAERWADEWNRTAYQKRED